MPPNVHPAAWELISQNSRNGYSSRHRRDSSWEEREHDVFAEEQKSLQPKQQQWPFFDQQKCANATTMTPELREALDSVRVLENPLEHREWLEKHNGSLGDVPPQLLESLR